MNETAGSSRQGRLYEPPFFIPRLYEPPFFVARLVGCMRAAAASTMSLLLAAVCSFAPNAFGASAAWIIIGEPGATELRTLDCASGGELARTELPAALTAPIVWASPGDAVFATTGGARLLRYSLPDLRERARTALRFDATTLAASSGSDAVVLAGGGGSPMLSAHDPQSLATLHEYRHEGGATVSAILDVPARSRFALAFSDLPEVWEIAYDRDAPPVLQGLVHDYRMREAVELPGRLTPRRFRIPDTTRSLVAGAADFELLRIDASGGIGVVHLEVRREIERPALTAVPPAWGIAAWRSASQRGWVLGDEGDTELRVLHSGNWRPGAPVPLPGALVALAPDEGRVLVAHRSASASAIVVSTLDVVSGEWRTVANLDGRAAAPLRFVGGTNGCVALVDRHGSWQAGLTRETREAARRRGS